MPEVSVILPNYNHSAYLDRRVESILNQTFQDFELIILDDASTDDSLEVLRKYKEHPKVKAIVSSESNSGSTFIQWEKGLKMAKGNFIWIAESDDIAEPAFLELHVNKLSKNDELGLSFSASSWINNEDQIIHEPNHENDFVKKGSELLKNEMGKGTFIYNASSAVFRKSLIPWEKLNLIKQFKYCGDWLFWIGFAEQSTISRDHQRFNKFRRHQQNVSFESEEKGLQFSEGFEVLNYLLKTQKYSFTTRFKLLLHWSLKLRKSKVRNKSQYLHSLPSDARLTYLLSSILVFLKLR
ncbi:glycosyltransferase family 2 protein [Jiulongibacter sp. NS-SX5]|uniref:glycosyltransferase family 2 protein n=1 Tax=Jiulongibacter sp. NS-SX5 TaxID=3463854 RepID=UPI004058A17E